MSLDVQFKKVADEVDRVCVQWRRAPYLVVVAYEPVTTQHKWTVGLFPAGNEEVVIVGASSDDLGTALDTFLSGIETRDEAMKGK